MSKSVKRVRQAIEAAGLIADIHEMSSETRTAAQAAAALGCAVDQIAKSIVFQGEASGAYLLFLTAGGRTVQLDRASALAGEPLHKADAAGVRAATGFVIGGVAPVGHITRIRVFCDENLLAFDQIWAAAGTPRHVFVITPDDLVKITDVQISDFSS